MENLKIEIVITDGEKKAKAEIPVKDYKTVKELHGGKSCRYASWCFIE